MTSEPGEPLPDETPTVRRDVPAAGATAEIPSGESTASLAPEWRQPGSGHAGQAQAGPVFQPGQPYQPGPVPPPPGGPFAPGRLFQPGQPFQAEPPTTSHGTSRVAKGFAVVAGAVVLSLCSGLIGGLIGGNLDDSSPPPTVTRVNGPTVELTSLADVAAKVQPSVVSIQAGQSEGSGIVISKDGAILTNNHVVADADGGVEVTFSSGTTAKASVVGTDPAGDIAVIKAEGVKDLTEAKFGDSDSLRIGDSVLALGSPLGLEGSVTVGIVSALHRIITPGSQSGGGGASIADAIQTDAAINPGNSGGALVNVAGEVIGVNTAIATSNGGAGNIGVGFAIPSNKAKYTAEQLLKGGKVSHPYIGVRLGNGQGGALISDVVAGGPAEQAGLRKGDLVIQAGTRTITDANGLVGAVQAAKPGDKLQLTIRRNNAQEQVTVTIGEKS